MEWWGLSPVRAALDVMAPRECCACGARLTDPGENGLCWECRAAVHPIAPPWCRVCGARVAGRVDHEFVCADCKARPPRYDRGRSLYAYEGGIREAIHALKYRRDFSVVPDLARLLVAGLRTYFPSEEGWVLTPVPLHRHRLAHRGFNQGEEVIRAARRLEPGIHMWRGLRRVKNTESQTRLSKAARHTNVRGAFAASPGSAPAATVILFDDVMTTGATLDACAGTLKHRAKVDTVHTLTLARG